MSGLRALKTIYDRLGNTHKRGAIVNENAFNHSHLNKLFLNGSIERVNIQTLTPFKGNIKPVIVTGMWKRFEVFKAFAEHTKTLGIDVIVAGSEGADSENLANQYGFDYLEAPNDPLGAKINATILRAKQRGYTHVICVGSDDLLSKELIDEYLILMRKGYDFIGLSDFYFYETQSGKASYWGGYRDRTRIGKTTGAGRVISCNLLNKLDWKPWNDSDNKYLDSGMQSKLSALLYSKKTISLKAKGLLAVDIKSSENITPFKLWDNCKYINPELITDKFNALNDV